jgi:chromate transporter
LALVGLLCGRESVFWQEGVFFSKAAVVTFGGAYSVLAYVAQQAVENYGWLMPGEMLDGLGMAETTPGPLIMVVQFVGFMGAYRHPGDLDPLMAGILGSLMTTWVTFVPCFYWIFLGAPYIERLRGNRLLAASLTSITAAVVGVILNLAVWFAIHVIFGVVHERRIGGIRLLVPDWSTIDVAAAALACLALALTFYWKRGIAVTMVTCAGLGALAYFFIPSSH